ncbi:uroporphyrinogen-III synthase [Pseudomonas sp. BRG-100]|uniref:uroporphyrinogen-III synthase n=1 Tax=unclassified Pseudomonas TaxID=196821 RepID=UPI0004E70E4D|nr:MULTISPECIES: uroporphyrinogen-III synthase [unclassified Pseudomonas]KFF45150.1 uroporphyrinogen-III synthase [Pseudomonas sp. BRG-100]MCK3849586.1 uroporphyrinogen-III synthase [Pseudomonas sp. W2Jun17]QUW67005.1 uroporphyrinogen-III synthase [Pseudomonas synxantha]UEH08332.1 uroporphyrinogen-III synthase [Pseudomonas sp. HN8-3]
MTDWRVLLTRPAEESTALAALLSQAGIYSSRLPLLETQALAVTAEQQAVFDALQRYCAVIVVSKPAARLALQRLGNAVPPMPWFSVGAATAQILAGHGLDVHYPATGDDSEALLQLPALREAIAQPGAKVLILRGEGGRELLAERLREQGASVDYLELYRRFLPVYETGALMQRIRLERLNGLVVSSGQGFLHLQALAGTDWPQVAQLPLFVPSPRVYEMARAAGAKKVVDCRGASAAALLVALGSYPVPTL